PPSLPRECEWASSNAPTENEPPECGLDASAGSRANGSANKSSTAENAAQLSADERRTSASWFVAPMRAGSGDPSTALGDPGAALVAAVSAAMEMGTNEVWVSTSAGADKAGGCIANREAVTEPLNKSEVGDSRRSNGSTSRRI